mmetsp:Transcript_32696/g.75279  ORF Transcript_32696/g.75279 Transcript_32696/m.75279 type:complete len:134 (+) Transcript_32696:278-679(+)|eukprot:CAMPEP_0116841382 /NCGR_PEP_ID=MMETSP0418-20121206/10892_1 /TAXON_ID=1158023 /ORGANISM="Astrosyne radiata, Strain 13vi08-1A" /LENGTH=133 /DNA_ID=CAMNT_0004471799 /DNA_START=272 /DNA_END=676 /DNA_ORIENTATION=-
MKRQDAWGNKNESFSREFGRRTQIRNNSLFNDLGRDLGRGAPRRSMPRPSGLHSKADLKMMMRQSNTMANLRSEESSGSMNSDSYANLLAAASLRRGHQSGYMLQPTPNPRLSQRVPHASMLNFKRTGRYVPT